MGNITQKQYDELKELMEQICDKATHLKRIQGEYEYSENKKQFDRLKEQLYSSSSIKDLRELESDMADFIEVRFNSYLDNPKSEADDEVAALMSEYLEKSNSFTMENE